MTNAIILAAGSGNRFKNAGIKTPKPAIIVNDMPMVAAAAKCLPSEYNYIFITQRSYSLKNEIIKYFDNAKVMQLDTVTDGAAVTALLAIEHINNKDDLFILNCDQILEYDHMKFMTLASMADGGLGIHSVDGDRWSFAEVSGGLITRVAEKERISSFGLVGLHYWKHGSDFVKYAMQMINEGSKVNGEYYIAPVYQYAINDGKKIVPFIVDKFWEIGTPESLQAYKGMVE